MQTNLAFTPEMQLCLQAWKNCHQVCLETLNYCLERPGRYKNVGLLCSLRDCAEMSLICIHLMTDGSEFMGRTGLICEEMCLKCAKACEELGDDPQLLECAELCRQSANHAKSVGMAASSYFRRESYVTEPTLWQAIA